MSTSEFKKRSRSRLHEDLKKIMAEVFSPDYDAKAKRKAAFVRVKRANEELGQALEKLCEELGL